MPKSGATAKSSKKKIPKKRVDITRSTDLFLRLDLSSVKTRHDLAKVFQEAAEILDASPDETVLLDEDYHVIGIDWRCNGKSGPAIL